ncbi:Acb2/Tad1 domain-containing protein [Microvirga sp. G4-2]|uniref:Acb2/Tad1 domain-containing protein n=1 Tax=Microvirga sp. G4-2 TaxID=3434467 RepID=UPI0040449592
MTDHKPMPVSGYKPQKQAAIDLANEGKALEERVLRYLDRLQRIPPAATSEAVDIDQRMVALGRTNIQQGFMWAIRSIFQPGRVSLPEDK